jgi:hypothetical protein
MLVQPVLYVLENLPYFFLAKITKRYTWLIADEDQLKAAIL